MANANTAVYNAIISLYNDKLISTIYVSCQGIIAIIYCDLSTTVLG